MLKYYFISLFIFSFLTIYPQSNTLAGKWMAIPWSEMGNSNKSNNGTFEIKKDNSISMDLKTGNIIEGKYKLNNKKKPNWIDVTVNSPNKTTMFGLYEWIDKDNVKIEFFNPSTKTHPINFSDNEGIVENIILLKRMTEDGVVKDKHYVNQSKIIGSWQVFPWAERFNPSYKSSTVWEFNQDEFFTQKGSPLWESDMTGNFSLNNTVNPNWIDLVLYSGLVQGVFEFLGDNEIKLELFPNTVTSEHPTQFSDVLYGNNIYGVDRNIFYLTRIEK